ncbi:putative Rhodanese-like domain-containing protein [Lupinus albus]|uniref:Putative Rhodanese-like domain-containing protein n=1 Tax=Lupinus albus TaxID=3870 RepID=A0A6A4P2Z0_LUPAL|nr:putative Rhodanese-like domain-containing protein [Lupinus albus]
MEALNAASLNPLSVFSDRRKQPRKLSSLPTISACKVSNFSTFSNKKKQTPTDCLSGGLIFAASVVNNGLAKALTYEEALGQSVTTSSGDFDANGVVDSVISFASENPIVIAGGVAVLAVPFVLSQVLNKPKPWGVETAQNAYVKLGANVNAQLLDIRAPIEIRQVGTPDVKGLKKKPVSIAYKGDDKPGFLKKLSLKFSDPEDITLFILDKFDGNSELVAELVTANGFKSAYAIKDGAEGPRGWTNSGLPWTEPRKGLSLDFGSLTEAISDSIGDTSDGLAVVLGIAAATGLGLLAFTEIETILEVVGSAALVQFASKKLLFAEDRKQTLQQVDEFLNTKVAPKELVDEIKQIGKALLPASTNAKALPVPTEKSPDLATADTTVQKAEATTDVIPESKVDAVAEPAPETEKSPDPITADSAVQKAEANPDTVSAPEINSVPKTEVKADSLPAQPKPLSPYPYYPDLKPPTSPSPSQP